MEAFRTKSIYISKSYTTTILFSQKKIKYFNFEDYLHLPEWG